MTPVTWQTLSCLDVIREFCSTVLQKDWKWNGFRLWSGFLRCRPNISATFPLIHTSPISPKNPRDILTALRSLSYMSEPPTPAFQSHHNTTPLTPPLWHHPSTLPTSGEAKHSNRSCYANLQLSSPLNPPPPPLMCGCIIMLAWPGKRWNIFRRKTSSWSLKIWVKTRQSYCETVICWLYFKVIVDLYLTWLYKC